MPLRKEAANKIMYGYKGNEVITFIIFDTEDVQTIADRIGAKISDKQAEEIIERVHRSRSAETGINWSIIEEAVMEYIKTI